MIYQVLYRVENSEKIRKRYKIGRYMLIKCDVEGDKKKCVEYARKMNQHLKKFHHEYYGKCIYFIREI